MSLRYIIILFVLLAGQVKSQGYQLFSGNVPGQTAVELKWFGKQMKLENAYDVYRKDAGGTWQKLNDKPLKRAAVLSKAELKSSPKTKHDEALYKYSFVMNDTAKGQAKLKLKFFILCSQALNDNDMADVLGLYFIDKTVANGKSYDYRLTAAGSSAESFLATANITATDYTQPDGPDALKTGAKEKQVELKWKWSPKAIAYNIYRYSTGAKPDTLLQLIMNDDEIALAKADKFFFTDNDKNLKQGITYKYRVAATDAFGHETKLSAEATASLIDLTPPKTVQSFRVNMNPADKTAVLKFKPSTSDDCIGYNVYRSKKKDSDFQKLNSALLGKNDSSFIDKSVAEGQEYFYYVDALDKSNNVARSLPASIVIADLTPPAVPTGFKAVSDTGKIYLSWNKNTESDLIGYLIFRALKTDLKNFNMLTAKPISANRFTDTLEKQAGNFFVYKICAVDNSWNRSETTANLLAKVIDIVAPTAPPIEEISADDAGVKLKLGKSASLDIRELEIQRRVAEDSTPGAFKKVNTVAVTGTADSYTDRLVQKGIAYTYQVIAIDSSGNRSLPSMRKSISGASTAGNNFEPADFRAVYNGKTKAVELAWKESAAEFVLGYKVYRKRDDGGYIPISATAKGTSMTDNAVEGNASCTYKIMAIALNGQSKFSKEVKVEIK